MIYKFLLSWLAHKIVGMFFHKRRVHELASKRLKIAQVDMSGSTGQLGRKELLERSRQERSFIPEKKQEEQKLGLQDKHRNKKK